MFYSKCLLSRKGRLGSIWVAAYCFKKLKKAQVTETDISSSIDKILQDEWDVVAYRVLAHLLIGVVRIYSRKVDYLFDDCNEVLAKIKKIAVSTKYNAHEDTLRAPYDAVTLPDRFELDAFDMGILEEDISSDNLVSRKEITLQDFAKGKGIGQFSSEMYGYGGFGTCHSIFAADYNPVRDVFASQENKFCDEECYGAEDEPSDHMNQFGEGHENNGEQIALCENGNQGDDVSQGANVEKFQDYGRSQEGLDLETIHGIAGEPSCHVASSGQDHQIDQEEIMVQSENHTCPMTKKDSSQSNMEANVGNLKSRTSSQENLDLNKFCCAQQSQEIVGSNGEENQKDVEPTKLQDMISTDNVNRQNVAEKNPVPLGITTPKLRSIPTPATKKLAQVSKKRKCIFDDIVVLRNELIKQSIQNASNLVSKRRKIPETALAVWKISQNGNLSRNLLEPLLPGASPIIKSLFCKRKTRPDEIVVPARKLAVSGLPITGRLKKVQIAPSASVLEQIDVAPGTPVLQKSEIAPGTPVLHSTSMKSFHSPRSPEPLEMDVEGPEPFKWVEKEPCVASEQAYPSKSEEVPFMDNDQEDDFNLLNEEINIEEENNSEPDGWSSRTRAVARYLHKQFTESKDRGEEKVNLLQVAEGRTKKESARLFYEILVLKTKECVDVKQDEAYGSILIQKTQKWDQTWGQYGE